jgi:2Fe-2S ferredoxin
MPKVTYILSDGSEHVVDVPAGSSVMQGSVSNNLPGIIGECGGNCACATCHVHVDPKSAMKFAGISDEERELLSYTDGTKEDSRLSCQLILGEDTEEVRVHVARMDR